jgi:hypothetical protein
MPEVAQSLDAVNFGNGFPRTVANPRLRGARSHSPLTSIPLTEGQYAASDLSSSFTSLNAVTWRPTRLHDRELAGNRPSQEFGGFICL